MLLGGKVNIGALVETERNKRLAKLKIVFPAFLIRYICLNKRGGKTYAIGYSHMVCFVCTSN